MKPSHIASFIVLACALAAPALAQWKEYPDKKTPRAAVGIAKVK